MTGPVRLAVVGAGAIGRQHVGHVVREPCAALAAIVDPSDAGQALAAELGVPCHRELGALLQDAPPEGVIVATPNPMHVAHGLQAVAAGLPVLVEKPLADELADAERLVDAAEAAGVALMTGHHRRHNPLIQAARRAIDQGRLGRLVAVHGQCWFHKPTSYFDIPWRRQPGAGPVLINLIHDIDLLRYLCGEVSEVQAMDSNAVRGNEVEDTAVVLLRFANGALGTLTVSDAAVSPWSWECTSGENPAYPRTDQACYTIAGTLGGLAVPQLDLWTHAGAADWMRPLGRERLDVPAEDPLALQVRNLCGVVRGTAAPVVSGRDGLETLRVVAALKQAAATRRPVRVH